MKKILEHARRADISFSRNGRILITARVARMLNLTTGDCINIIVDDGEYLLFAVHVAGVCGRFEARCYPTCKHRSLNYAANSVRLCHAMLALAPGNPQRVGFILGHPSGSAGDIRIPIITKYPL